MTEKNKSVPRCPANDMQVDRSIPNLWTCWAANPPSHFTYEDVCDPKFFGAFRTRYPKAPRANDAGLRIGDIICVRPKNCTFQAELVVVDIPEGTDEVYTREISKVDFVCEDVPKGYEIKDYGVVRGWTIELNGQIIECNFVTQEQAVIRAKWLDAQNAVHERVSRARQSVASATDSQPKTRTRRKKTETAEVSEQEAA